MKEKDEVLEKNNNSSDNELETTKSSNVKDEIVDRRK